MELLEIFYGGDRLKNKNVNNCKLTRIRAGKLKKIKAIAANN